MISENLKRIREAKGMSQSELSRASGISQSMIAQLERGTKVLTFITAKILVDALGCRLDDQMCIRDRDGGSGTLSGFEKGYRTKNT